MSTTPESVQRLVAFQGEMELLGAAWDLNSGRTVELRVIEDHREDRLHPFKKYQKRRNGRVGTRFHCVMTHVVTQQIVLNGEVQLAAWAEGSDKGQSVKLWLDEESSLHPFAGFRGKRGNAVVGEMFVGVFVELDDDQEPIDQEKRDRVERGERQNRLSQYAWMLAHRTPRFLQFLTEKVTKPSWVGDDWTTEGAHKYIKARLNIESLGDLDRFDQAAKNFHEHIRRPYARFTGEL